MATAALNIGEVFGGIGSLEKTKHDVLSSALNFFSKSTVEPYMESGSKAYVWPVSRTNDSGPFDFDIPSGGHNQFFQTHDIRLNGSFRIVRADNGEPITQALHADHVGLVNNYPHSLWKSIEIHINGQLISSLSGNHYAHKSFLENLLSYDEQTMNTITADYLWKSPTIDDEANYHVLDHHAKSKEMAAKGHGGAALNFSIPLNFDFIHVSKLIPPGVNMRFKFVRNPDSFTFLNRRAADAQGAVPAVTAGIECKIAFDELYMSIRKIDIDAGFSNRVQKSVMSGNAMGYDFTRTEIKTWQIPAGQTIKHVQGMFSGKLPKMIILGMLDSRAFSGDRFYDPYCFQPFGLTDIRLVRNNTLCPALPYQPTKEGYARMYRDFHDNLGNVGNVDVATTITPKMFETTKFLLVETFAPPGGHAFEEFRSTYGDISVTANFAAQEHPITLMAFGCWNSNYFISGEPKILQTADQLE